jgi:hypothetical protein
VLGESIRKVEAESARQFVEASRALLTALRDAIAVLSKLIGL